MTFKETKVGDYIFRPKPGISYKRSLRVVAHKEGVAIALTNAHDGSISTISEEQFNSAKFAPVTGEMIAMEN